MIGIFDALRSVLFPGYFGISELNAESVKFHVGSTLDRTVRLLEDQVRRGLCFGCSDAQSSTLCEERAHDITNRFIAALPNIQRLLAGDVLATYRGDPAATHPDEAIFCYPGMWAVTCYRLAHELFKLGVPLLPRMLTEHAHSTTGIDIHPGATIGEEFFIDHGTGVVIGETCIIGNRVRIYQGVTLGAKSFPLDQFGRPIKGVPRHPIVEDDVIIYSGATILGRITLGKGCMIGGNVWLTQSVPPGCKVTQAKSYQEVFESGGGI
jgi:serine O-acetyltransferase